MPAGPGSVLHNVQKDQRKELSVHRTTFMTRRLFCLVIACFVLAGSGKDSRSIRRAVLDQVQRYPKMEIQDLYKLSYQAAMGNEHLMSDSVEARRYLLEELNSIGADTTVPLVEVLTDDSAVIRVNLGPFKAQNGDAAALMAAMMDTPKTFRKSVDLLRRYWDEISVMGKEKQIPFDPEQLRRYFAEQESLKFPAVHHSDTYEREYRPAYRVILRQFMPR